MLSGKFFSETSGSIISRIVFIFRFPSLSLVMQPLFKSNSSLRKFLYLANFLKDSGILSQPSQTTTTRKSSLVNFVFSSSFKQMQFCMIPLRVCWSSDSFSLYIVMQTANLGFIFLILQRVLIFESKQVFLIYLIFPDDLNPAGRILQFNSEFVKHSVSYVILRAGFHSWIFIIDIMSVRSFLSSKLT